MERGAEEVQTAEITTAVRDVRFDSLDVRAGQVIGLLDGELVVAGSEPNDVAVGHLDRMDTDQSEILTLYYGNAMPQSSAQALVEQLEGLYPDLEIELVEGGQPHYHYIISAE
jgi:dihydroxyacetone kinase-like predicted kinase